MADTPKISAYLKGLRQKSALTQQNVADRFGITPQAVSKWERGESMPDITLLPELAQMYGTSVEGILSAGEPQEITLEDLARTLNQFVGEGLFQKILDAYRKAADAREINFPGDIFMALNNGQKDILLEYVPEMDNCSTLIDEILQYINSAQRSRLIKKIAGKGDYSALELLLPFASRGVRTEIAMLLLERKDFGFLEEMILFLNREQKDMIIDYIAANGLDWEILDSFLPFFDKSQRKAVERMEEKNE